MSTIRTYNPGLRTTLAAIAVCIWALAAEFAAGVRGTTKLLWRDYRKAQQDRRAWEADLSAAFHAAHTRHAIADVDAEQLDESALQSLGRELGGPLWLWGGLLAIAAAVALIDIAGGWPLLADAAAAAAATAGRALTTLARS